jgi:hypothetical protein
MADQPGSDSIAVIGAESAHLRSCARIGWGSPTFEPPDPAGRLAVLHYCRGERVSPSRVEIRQQEAGFLKSGDCGAGRAIVHQLVFARCQRGRWVRPLPWPC